MLVTAAQMKAVEEAAFARGVSAEDLMERAGLAIAREIVRFFPEPAQVLAVCGKGNNAGDVLVAARHLREAGWSAGELLAFPEDALSPLSLTQLARLRETPTQPTLQLTPRRLVVLDGLLGIGTQGAPREPIAGAIRQIEALRTTRGAFVVAADIPSGLDADTGIPASSCVTADLTVTIGLAKAGLVADTATAHVGRLALAPLAELTTDRGDPAALITPETLRPLHFPPSFDSHKGLWGRVGIVAGSRGYLGAARLCSMGALRAGGGLITLYTPADIYDLLATGCPPEIMVKPVKRLSDILDDRLDALAIGPGLGTSNDGAILEILEKFPAPAVVDADALNVLSRSRSWPVFAAQRLFTPHPGEMQRLFSEAGSLTRRETAEKFTSSHPVTLLLKGARTIVAEAGKATAFNTTGNPGMGTGGMGDVLTGVAAALLARNFPAFHAAMLGAWLCGRAAELAVFARGGSPESLSAGDIPHHLGGAFAELSLSFADPAGADGSA